MKTTIIGLTLAIALLIPSLSKAHCEIPCGIYGDSVQVALLKEHIATIAKSIKMINELSAAEKPDYNQLVRWVSNKEDHAEKMQEILSQYFLHQRVKIAEPSDKAKYDKYIEQLTLVHKLMVLAMKSKQSADPAVIEKMQATLHEFEHAYFG